MLGNFFRKKTKVTSLAEKKFYSDLQEFIQLDSSRFKIDENDLFPCLNDNTEKTNFDAHYIYHPAWAARIVKEISPIKHIDISSTLYFSTILSAFIPVDFYDFRPAELKLSNLISQKGDLLKFAFETNSIPSLSCMHTIEHIGLGRYGDPLDPDGDLKAIRELKRVCAIGGSLLIVVPVGSQRIAFNAHRIYDPTIFLTYMTGFKLQEFSLITDSEELIKNASLEEGAQQNYGCGCFWFIKE
ncbi:DUF268 domain-containing protein [Pedobacter sp. MW01-1-1]|uniref:DUF268 domain-containing protein n=1 Tax=Pedobacter sp. MW01-1-1 TaxID=3383027 RepID=UPI003FF06345